MINRNVQQDESIKDYVVALEACLEKKEHDKESLEEAESALEFIEFTHRSYKKLPTYKCKLYPIIIKNLLENKTISEDDLKKADNFLVQLKTVSCKITDVKEAESIKLKILELEKLLTRKKLFMKSGGVAGNASSLFGSREEQADASLEELENARKTLAETEEVGKNVLKNLEEQKGKIKNAKKNVDEINSELNYSNRLLKKMSSWWRG